MESGIKTTFFGKEPLKCPVCEASFYKEDYLTGSGRLIAGELTDELHRLYEPSKKYGEIFPLVYQILVCPSCFFAATASDFFALKPPVYDELRERREARIRDVSLVFPDIDYNEPRRLVEGAASYFLLVHCYDVLPVDFNPTFKQGLSSLRAAWLCADLHKKFSNENYDYLAQVFYRKARFFYKKSLEQEQNGKEPLSNVKHMGPDLDKNYGYEGLIYLMGLLEYKYGPASDPGLRAANLDEAKRMVAKIFGMGKASKAKPSALLDKAKDLYESITNELKGGGDDEL